MRTTRLLYHMARADLLERLRRYSFLITLGLVVFLGYQVNTGNAAIYLDQYRGIFNSAWVGSMLTVVSTFFLGWFGFYLVKGSIARDYKTGVGQIIAMTPIHRVEYMLGKWLSSLTVLMLMMAILAGAGLLMQLFQREDPRIDLILRPYPSGGQGKSSDRLHPFRKRQFPICQLNQLAYTNKDRQAPFLRSNQASIS